MSRDGDRSVRLNMSVCGVDRPSFENKRMPCSLVPARRGRYWCHQPCIFFIAIYWAMHGVHEVSEHAGNTQIGKYTVYCKQSYDFRAKSCLASWTFRDCILNMPGCLMRMLLIS